MPEYEEGENAAQHFAHAGARRVTPMLDVSIKRCGSTDQAGWLPLRTALWPHCAPSEQLSEMSSFLADPSRFVQFVAYGDGDRPVGLVEASIRMDHVPGTDASPVAFVEGIYVLPELHRNGIGTSLVAAVTGWASSMGCHELASDASLENDVSLRFHRALGFEETERVVFFRKELSPR